MCVKKNEVNVLKIILMRHYKVDIEHKEYVDSYEYQRSCLLYNERPVINQPPPLLPEYRLYCSSMRRAKETAQYATGREPELLKGVYEVTFNSHRDSKGKRKFNYWEAMARVQWFRGNRRQYEVKSDTVERLSLAADILEERGEDAIVVMHGFVMRILSRILIKRGFKGPKVYMAKNGQIYEYEK